MEQQQQTDSEEDLNGAHEQTEQQPASDEDEDEASSTTIEFEIEVVSNNSCSKQGSLDDLREVDSENDAVVVVAAATTDSVEEPPPSQEQQQQQQQQLEQQQLEQQQLEQSTSQAIVDTTTAEPSEEKSVAAQEGEPESAPAPGNQESADNCEVELQVVQIIPVEVHQEPVVNQEEEEEEGESVDWQIEVESVVAELEPEEMKLEEQQPHDDIAQVTTEKNDDLSRLTADDRQVAADEELPSTPIEEKVEEIECSETIETNNVVDELAEVEPASVERVPIVDEREKCTPVDQPVGSKNIREIYKVLNSDSELIVGCRPGLIAAVDKQQTIPEEETELPIEVSIEQVEDDAATLLASVCGPPSGDEPRPTTPQSPEITIEHSSSDIGPVEEAPLVATTIELIGDANGGGGEKKRRCSTTESEDLEWEFENEPVFEKRDVMVKRGKDPRAEYELGGELGRGKFGTVFRCTHKVSGKQLAAKFVLTRRKEDREDVEREVEIMSLLQHKRLLQLYDAFDNGTNEMCLITELVEGGELFERIVDDDFDLTEKKAAIFMRQICEGVEYMHSLNIVHMDMKPENILCISRTGNRIKLIDFGLARRLDPSESLRVMFGTPDFAAPEVLCYDTVSLATDMWSVGVICYVLLSGLSPFMGNNDMETMANVTRATYDFDEDAFEPISDLAKDFIAKLLLRDQAQRLKPAECLKHAWLAKGGHELEVAVRERRKSIAIDSSGRERLASIGATPAEITEEQMERLNALASSITVSLDKRNLKKYVVRRKWHKTVHAIMALGRMGAKLKTLI